MTSPKNDSEDDESLEPPELFHVLVPREEWGALPPKGPQTLIDIPARNVRYTMTETENCYTTERCAKAMRELQKDHMDKGCSDIMYNFLIGGDGKVYEGRGWKVEGEVPPQFEDLKRETVDVAFIGTFKPGEIAVPVEIVDVARGLIDWGTDHNMVAMPFTVKEYNEDENY